VYSVLLRNRLSGVAVAMVATLALVGCSSTERQATDDVVLYTSTTAQPGDEALVVGTIAITEGGCVGIADSEGVTRSTVWPSGTELTSADPLELTLPDGSVLSAGSPVEGAGGYYSDPPEFEDITTGCRGGTEIIRIRF
jgi:type IV pilus biogenesis protein CpaD/CtpE